MNASIVLILIGLLNIDYAMSKTLCYSVRVLSLTYISNKAVKIISFDGSEDIFPDSQIFGEDYDVTKSEAYWLASWLLPKKNIQYSSKKQAWFDNATRCQLPNYKIVKHIPKKINKKAEIDASLTSLIR